MYSNVVTYSSGGVRYPPMFGAQSAATTALDLEAINMFLLDSTRIH